MRDREASQEESVRRVVRRINELWLGKHYDEIGELLSDHAVLARPGFQGRIRGRRAHNVPANNGTRRTLGDKGEVTVRADARTEGEVKAALQQLTDAYAKRDLQVVSDCFASDADVVLFGTGADERRIGLEQIRAQVERDWAQSESAEMSFTWISVSAAGAVAWAAVDGAFKFRADGQDGVIPARVSLVLEKRQGRWLIVHAHFSTPAAGQDEDRSFPAG